MVLTGSHQDTKKISKRTKNENSKYGQYITNKSFKIYVHKPVDDILLATSAICIQCL